MSSVFFFFFLHCVFAILRQIGAQSAEFRVCSLNVPRKTTARYKICNIFIVLFTRPLHPPPSCIHPFIWCMRASVMVITTQCSIQYIVVLMCICGVRCVRGKKNIFVKFDIAFCFILCRCRRRSSLCVLLSKKKTFRVISHVFCAHQFKQTSHRTCTRIFELLSREHSSRVVTRR